MPPKLKAEGSTGRVAIYDSATEAAFTNPQANLDKVFFHSDLDYFVMREKFSATITLPSRNIPSNGDGGVAVSIGGFTVWESGEDGGTVTGAVDSHLIGTHSVTDPFPLAIIDGSVISGTQIIRSNALQRRAVSVGVTSTEVLLYEAWNGAGGQDLPSEDVSVTVYLFSTATAPDASEIIKMTPNRIIASAGKLDSDGNHVKLDATSSVKIPTGEETIDLGDGGMRYIDASGNTVDRWSYASTSVAATLSGLTGVRID
jgi:hypothetical protein